MHKINKSTLVSLLLICFLALPAISRAAREYKPVDQLGRSSSLPKPAMVTPRASKPAAPTSLPSQSGRSFLTPNGDIKLFGTVEFRRPLDTLPGWLDVLKRNSASPIFELQKRFNKSTTWEILKQKAEGKTPIDKLRLVNSFWNSWPYIEDMANWGKADYWEIPAEFLPRSGDCEDYAIVKYFTLKELGFDPGKMRLVVLKDTIRNLGHAVLAVYLDDDAWVLDNLSNVVLSHKRLANYSPQYSVNEYSRWAHIKGKKAN